MAASLERFAHLPMGGGRACGKSSRKKCEIVSHQVIVDVTRASTGTSVILRFRHW